MGAVLEGDGERVEVLGREEREVAAALPVDAVAHTRSPSPSRTAPTSASSCGSKGRAWPLFVWGDGWWAGGAGENRGASLAANPPTNAWSFHKGLSNFSSRY